MRIYRYVRVKQVAGYSEKKVIEARKKRLLGRGSKGYICDWVALDHSAAPAERGGGKEKAREGVLQKVAGASPQNRVLRVLSRESETASSFELSLHWLTCFQSITFLLLDKQSLPLFYIYLRRSGPLTLSLHIHRVARLFSVKQ
jgi:hypothetical protein